MWFRYGCSPVNFLHIFGTLFTKNTTGHLLLFIYSFIHYSLPYYVLGFLKRATCFYISYKATKYQPKTFTDNSVMIMERYRKWLFVLVNMLSEEWSLFLQTLLGPVSSSYITVILLLYYSYHDSFIDYFFSDNKDIIQIT